MREKPSRGRRHKESVSRADGSAISSGDESYVLHTSVDDNMSRHMCGRSLGELRIKRDHSHRERSRCRDGTTEYTSRGEISRRDVSAREASKRDASKRDASHRSASRREASRREATRRNASVEYTSGGRSKERTLSRERSLQKETARSFMSQEETERHLRKSKTDYSQL